MDETTRNLLSILDSLNKNISEGVVLNYEFDSHLNEQQLASNENSGSTFRDTNTDVVLRISYIRGE